MRVSIVIDNYNYERFIAAAIESSLEQTYADTEIIIVDDGSTDGSRAIIDSYGNRFARKIFKENGGQGSAFNAGFAASTGDVLIYLDADDLLLPDAAATIADHADDSFAKLTWQMQIVGSDGKPTGNLEPAEPPEAGDMVGRLARRGPYCFRIAPTSGNAWSRRYLERVMPLPEKSYRRGPDDYLLMLSPLYGATVRINRPISCYRRHADNFLASQSEFEKMATLKRRHVISSDILAEALTEHGVQFDRSMWHHPHWDILERLRQLVVDHVPADATILLIDQDKLNVGRTFFGRPRRHLMEYEGGYYGPPSEGQAAVEQIKEMQTEGVRYVVLTSSCLWWLEHYTPLREFLENHGRRIVYEPAAAIFMLPNERAC